MFIHFIITVIGCFISSIVGIAIFYASSERGSMDVKFNEEDCVWDATMHLPATIDYSKTKKIIIKINHK
jgi:hypothetical protein